MTILFTPEVAAKVEALAKLDYSREELIELCEKAIVPEESWSNRDTPAIHLEIGMVWALLKAGCKFTVEPETNENIVSLLIQHTSSASFGYGDEPSNLDNTRFYLPTAARLDSRAKSSSDWCNILVR